jgi:hypothetical protein
MSKTCDNCVIGIPNRCPLVCVVMANLLSGISPYDLRIERRERFITESNGPSSAVLIGLVM